MSGIYLSVCIPTYNRKEYINTLFKSAIADSRVEYIVVDDGSNDGTDDLLKEFSDLNIVYSYKENEGRARALREAFELCTGKFIMVMDSDDYFIEDQFAILMDLLSSREADSVDCFITGQYIDEKENRLPGDIKTNFIKLRADLKIKGDCREIVRRDILVCNADKINWSVRRIPTYLLWGLVANDHDCLTVDLLPTVKQYLDDGMTKNIYALKLHDPEPMYELYLLLLNSPRYSSTYYRMRSAIQVGRYARHSNIDAGVNGKWMILIYMGSLIAVFEKISARVKQ